MDQHLITEMPIASGGTGYGSAQAREVTAGMSGLSRASPTGSNKPARNRFICSQVRLTPSLGGRCLFVLPVRLFSTYEYATARSSLPVCDRAPEPLDWVHARVPDACSRQGDAGTLYLECLWMDADRNVIGAHSFSDMTLERVHGHWLVKTMRVGKVEKL